MSNILVAKNYNITDHSKWYDDKTHQATSIRRTYSGMQEILERTAEKYVADLDAITVHEGEASDIREVFKTHFVEIYDLWKQGHNILYCDLDVMFLQPVKYFGQHDRFAMFNLTDPRKTTDSHYDVRFDWFFNCGIRYYPKDMQQSVWDLGLEMLDNWNPERWDCEQIIYNAMMFAQSPDPKQFYDPTKAFQILADSPLSKANSQFNQIQLSQACAVHLHGSRNSENRLETMKALESGAFKSNDVLIL